MTLVLGIGVNTAIFSMVRAVLLRSLPYPEADEIVRVWPEQRVSAQGILIFEESCHSFTALSAFGTRRATLTGDGHPEEIAVGEVSPRHFEVTGVTPHLGRPFAADERQPGRDAVVVLSHGLWQRRFGGDPAALGAAVILDERTHTVIGVMPEGYRPLSSSWQAWVPLVVDPGSKNFARWSSYRMVARLAPGVSAEDAQADVRGAVARLREVDSMVGQSQVEQATVARLTEVVVGEVGRSLLLLLATAGFVLLIGCANVANLLLARAHARSRELAIRGALGAGRGHLFRQLFFEAGLLGLAGCVLGVLSAAWSLVVLEGLLTSVVPRYEEVRIDAYVLTFALGASLVSVMVFGLAPTLWGNRLDLLSLLNSGGRRVASPRRSRLSQGLVALETALCVVLVIGSGLLARSFFQLRAEPLGFEPAGLVTFDLTLPRTRYPEPEKRQVYFAAVEEKLAALPGVLAVGAVNLLPVAGGDVNMAYQLPGQELPNGEEPPMISARIVTPGLLDTLGVPLMRGRWLSADDDEGRPGVALVNETMAWQLWPDQEAVGKVLLQYDGSPWLTVVGVVGDVRFESLEADPVAQLFLPLAQQPWPRQMSLVLKTRTTSFDLIRDTVWTIDNDVPISAIVAMDEVVRQSLSVERRLAVLVSAFAGLALVLAVVGIYGVTAYTASQRTHEVGVRMALGASTGVLVTRSVGRAMLPVVVGLAAGVGAALGLTPLLESFLYEVKPLDPWVFVAAPAVLAACATFAGWLPSRRAAGLDPVAVLRAD